MGGESGRRILGALAGFLALWQQEVLGAGAGLGGSVAHAARAVPAGLFGMNCKQETGPLRTKRQRP